MFKINRIKVMVWLAFFSVFFFWGWRVSQAGSEGQKTYVGSVSCMDCHETEYDNFKAHAKKARSYESIKKMQKRLTEEEFRGCFECHTTGYGKPGGFLSEKETPHLKNAGCEACHGPGSLHVESEEPDDIKGSLTTRDCDICHSPERVQTFKFKPLIHGGAH